MSKKTNYGMPLRETAPRSCLRRMALSLGAWMVDYWMSCAKKLTILKSGIPPDVIEKFQIFVALDHFRMVIDTLHNIFNAHTFV